MKKYYDPSIIISKFDDEDIVTTSGNALEGSVIKDVPEGQSVTKLGYDDFNFILTF